MKHYWIYEAMMDKTPVMLTDWAKDDLIKSWGDKTGPWLVEEIDSEYNLSCRSVGEGDLVFCKPVHLVAPDEQPALRHDEADDYILDGQSCWITKSGVSIYILEKEGTVYVDAYRKGCEGQDPIEGFRIDPEDIAQ